MTDLREELEQLRHRMDQLECQNRRLRRAWLALLVPALLPLLLGAMRPAQKLQLEPVPSAPVASGALDAPVVAPKFVVQDAHGKVRALLDSQGLFLFGPNRELRVWLTAEDLVYKGPDGRIRLALKAAQDNSSLLLRDAAGNETDLGTLNLTTPATTHHRNAASLVFQHHGVVLRALP